MGEESALNQVDEKDGYIIASTNPSWIKKAISEDKDFKKILTFYLINTPSVFSSCKSIPLEDYGWEQSVFSNDKFIDFLLDAVNLDHSSYMSVNHLGKMKMACEKQFLMDEFYKKRDLERIVVFTSKDNKNNNTPVKSLFYHLRNSFAHGRFEIYKNGNKTTFVMEDETPATGGHKVSARMILKKSTLIKWMEILQSGKFPDNLENA